MVNLRSYRWWAFIAIAILPLLLFAYLGHFSRLMSDDYCAIAVGQELGAWDGMRYWYTSWAGSYANFFFKSAIAPLDTLVPAITPVLIVGLWWLTATFVLAQACRHLWSASSQRKLPALLAGVTVAASLNAMYSPQSFYWFAASTHYILPLALLTGCLGLPLWISRRNGRPILVACACLTAAFCFVTGGASEIFVVFQFVFMTLCGLPFLLCWRQDRMRRPAVILAAGWLATLVAALVQLISPGLANRAAVDAALFGHALREPTALIVRTFELTVEYLGHPPAFAGFVLLAAAVLLTALRFGEAKSFRPMPAIRTRALSLGFLFQLVWIPLLWTHISDEALVLGRFSGGYVVVVIVNALLLIGFAMLLTLRDRINRQLLADARSQLAMSAIVLAVALLLFALTQLHSIHFRAAAYLFSSAVALLVLLAGQLIDVDSDKTLRRLNWLSLYSLVVAVAGLAAIVFAALFGRGFVDDRILAPAAYLLVIPGLFLGASIGLALKHALPSGGEAPTSIRVIETGCMVVAFIIALGITIGHLRLLPDFQSYATDWDTRHQQILEQRSSGQRDIVVTPLRFDLAEYVDVVGLGQDPANRCARRYYQVDSIVVAND